MGATKKPSSANDSSGEQEPSSEREPSSASDDLAAVWRAFRAGGVAVCRRDGGPMALSVDGSAAAYRFVCVGCGFASPWFSSGPAGMRVHGIGAMGEPIGSPGED